MTVSTNARLSLEEPPSGLQARRVLARGSARVGAARVRRGAARGARRGRGGWSEYAEIVYCLTGSFKPFSKGGEEFDPEYEI